MMNVMSVGMRNSMHSHSKLSWDAECGFEIFFIRSVCVHHIWI